MDKVKTTRSRSKNFHGISHEGNQEILRGMVNAKFFNTIMINTLLPINQSKLMNKRLGHWRIIFRY